MNKRRKNNIIIASLCAVVILMGVGYAAFSSQLNITGTSNITSNWDVRITNIESELNGATDLEAPTYDNTNGMYASFHTGLSKPGDYALYTITIENRGDIDARIEQINTYYQENEYVTFTLSGLSKGGVIGGSETRELQVRVEFNNDVTSIDGDIDISLDVSIDVAQDSDNPLPADEYYVTYDYTTNGGESSNAVNDYVAENENVNLSYTASKSGYEFMGWNTDKGAITGLDSYTMPANNTTLYAIFRLIDTTPPVIDNVSTMSTTNSITVVTTASDDIGSITKYEYNIDNGNYVEGSNSYTFNNLTQNTSHTIKVRVTNTEGLTTESEERQVQTSILNEPIFSEVETDSGKTVTITYPEGNGLTYEYQKNNGSWTTATQVQQLEYTESGTLVARVSDGINEESASYVVDVVPQVIKFITDLVSTNSNELYIDEHEDIRYYGKNPNNFVTFNNELWRIMGVIDGKVKIIRNNSIGDRQWNSNDSNNWNNSSLKTYLNGTYYNSIEELSRNMIANETYYLGGPTSSNYQTLTVSEYYDVERSNVVFPGNSVSTTQHIGLMYPSDYGYAAGSSCINTTLYQFSCFARGYLNKEVFQWVQTPDASLSNTAVFIDYFGYVDSYNTYVYASGPVFPVLYLKLEVQITGGNGSSGNPYQLSL